MPQNSRQEKASLNTEQEELLAQAREILRTSHKLIEELRENMRKFEKLLKRKNKN
jgi:hypothetical protein